MIIGAVRMMTDDGDSGDDYDDNGDSVYVYA